MPCVHGRRLHRCVSKPGPTSHVSWSRSHTVNHNLGLQCVGTLFCCSHVDQHNGGVVRLRSGRPRWFQGEGLRHMVCTHCCKFRFISTSPYWHVVQRLFAYIDGHNEDGVKIPMTAPVRVEVHPSQGPFCKGNFTGACLPYPFHCVYIEPCALHPVSPTCVTSAVSFYVPCEFQESPPKPSDPRLFVDREDEFTVYVAQSGGYVMDDFTLSRMASRLTDVRVLKQLLHCVGLPYACKEVYCQRIKSDVAFPRVPSCRPWMRKTFSTRTTSTLRATIPPSASRAATTRCGSRRWMTAGPKSAQRDGWAKLKGPHFILHLYSVLSPPPLVGLL